MKSKRNIFNIRAIFLYSLFVLISIAIAVKIIYIQGLQDINFDTNSPKFFQVEAPRGNIFSDDGSLLAISMPLYKIRLDMSVIEEDVFYANVDELAKGLSSVFNDKTPEEYHEFLIHSKNKINNKYILFKNKVTYNQLKLLKKLPIFELGQNRGGLIAEQRPHRHKPFGILAKRTIGILRSENPVGIERAFDYTLKGDPGKQLKQKVGNGIWLPKKSDDNKLPNPGSDVVTTINIDMQDITELSLHNALIEHEADWGCVILMEVVSGKIKAIANLRRDADTLIDEYYNYAIGEHFEPGSTFKLASIVAGIEDGYFEVEDSVDTKNGRHKFYDKVMLDSKEGGYGNITIGDAFVVSSNVGISKTIDKYYKDNPSQFLDRIYKMGLSTPLDIELPYANNLLIKNPKMKGWSGVTLPWMSIGYEMQLTPIHILTFYNAIANSGKMVAPIFTSKIIKEGEIIELRKSEVINPSICSKSTINKVIPLLKRVVDEGTANNIKTRKYNIAGKTGTTLLNYDDSRKEGARSYQASFAGFFPAENPKYSCIVIINNPKSGKFYGSNVAAPIFREVADKIFAFDVDIHSPSEIDNHSSNLPKIKQGHTLDTKILIDALGMNIDITNHEWMTPVLNKNNVSLKVRRIELDLKDGIMPNLIGMGVKDALYLLENYGLQVEYEGFGSIKEQSIIKGQKFKEGETIQLFLS
ncbi:MAG: penicillin-binding protein [Bacteroidota bacterium]|nr:penicillin-binding protein [Bacteroidota bacterium]